MSQRVLITVALAFAAGLALAAAPRLVPGSEDATATEHREVRRHVRRHRRVVRSDARPAPRVVQLARADLSYETFGRAGRALAQRGHDGEQHGYRLTAVRPDSITAHLGLRDGDVVTHVGGIPLTSMDRAIEAWQAVQHASEVTVQLIRDGRAERIVIELV